MSGNVEEWCMDKYSNSFYQECHEQGTVKNPICKKEDARYRLSRGGSWFNSPRFCRVSYRISWRPAGRDGSIGFRLVLAPVQG
jgi:formylglycine-generating enzyme required for sulfatase activity